MSEIKRCQHCGSTTYYIKQYVHGYGMFIVDTTGKEVNNHELHEHLQYRNVGKYAYCVDCGKRFAKIEDLEEVTND